MQKKKELTFHRQHCKELDYELHQAEVAQRHMGSQKL